MSKHKTKIGWTHQDGFIGETWNPVTGCTKISPGCDNCYAQAMLGRNLPGHTGKGVVCHPKRLTEPLNWKAPRCVFVCSMADLFHEDVPGTFIRDVFDVMYDHPGHRFLVLTKRPQRMWDFMRTWPPSPFPTPLNIALGVSVENQEMADERIPLLLDTPAALRFVSVEPMLEAVMPRSQQLWSCHECRIPHNGNRSCDSMCDRGVLHPPLDWVICGGETGPSARQMDVKWAESLRDQCDEANVPFYFKQMSRKAAIPEGLQIRQFPEWPLASDAGDGNVPWRDSKTGKVWRYTADFKKGEMATAELVDPEEEA